MVGGDLFRTPNCVVHCISADVHMRKGIAGEIRRRFGGIRELVAQQNRVGQVGVTRMPHDSRGRPRYVFHLVTKRYFWEKPTVTSLGTTLQKLKVTLQYMGITEVSAPWLGTGRDRLPREVVWNLLCSIFNDTGIVVTIHDIDII